MSNRLWFSLAFAVSLPVLPGGCASTTPGQPATAQPPSLLEKMTAGVKGGSKSLTAMFTPKPAWARAEAPEPANEKVGPNMFVAAAQFNEQSGNLEAAEAHYQKALKVDPNHLGALLGYARLEDRQNDFDSATKLYKQAMKRHPKEGAVHNDLGLCYHRHGMLPDAARSLQKAVELQPKKKLYRDNLAAVLVEQEKTGEALEQLTAAHGEAVANYNLAYLLVQRHKHAAALEYFRIAAEKDPSLTAARQWVVTLSSPAMKNGSFGNGLELTARRPSPLPPVEHDANAAFAAAPPLPSNLNPATQTVKASGVGNSLPDSSQRVPPQAEPRGVQFPQVRRRDESAFDANAPIPQSPSDSVPGDSRLPVVTP